MLWPSPVLARGSRTRSADLTTLQDVTQCDVIQCDLVKRNNYNSIKTTLDLMISKTYLISLLRSSALIQAKT